MVFHEITKAAIERALERDARDRRPARRRAGDAADPRPALRLRGLARPLAEGDEGPLRRAASSRSRRGSSSSASASGSSSAPPSTGTSSPRSIRARSRPASPRSTGRRSRRAATSPATASSRRTTPSSSTRPPRAALAAALEGAAFAVRSVERKPYTRRPAAPFMTSTLQQEASRKLRFSAQHTMRVAQRLYENGYITYMRTDSTSLSETAIAAARDQARELYGAESVPAEPRQYNRKVKNAQEAHEAIRPAGDRFRTPDEVRGEVARRRGGALRPGLEAHGRLADGRRARRDRLGSRSARRATDGRDVEFGTAGTVITFRGFMLAYEEGRDEAVAADEEERRLPPLAEGDDVDGDRRSSRTATRRPRRPATRRRRSCGRSRSAASAGRRPTRRSWARSSTAATCARRAGARAVVPRVRGHEPARAALHAARRLRVHGADGGRPRPDRGRHRGAQRVAAALLLRRRRRTATRG